MTDARLAKWRPGIATVADLKDRCVVDALSGCWVWQGGTNRKSLPVMHTFCHTRGDKRVMSGPLAAWNIAYGASPRPGWLVYRCCGNRLCLNPVHLDQVRGKAEMGQRVALSGRLKGKNLEQLRASIAKAHAACGIVKVRPEIVAAIRATPKVRGVGKMLALKHGLSESVVSRILRGEHYREAVAR